MALQIDRERAGRWGFRGLALATIAVIVAIRLVDLDGLPGEIYGDIAIVHDYMLEILAGHWPIHFVLSAGPLYHYVIFPVVWLGGLSYLTLKLASVVVSLAGLAATYALTRELLNDELALLSLFIAGVSSWLLIFSRLGNSQILLPLLSAAAAYFAVRVARHGRVGDAAACAVVSGLGLYCYPQSFVLPPVMFLTLLCLAWTRAGVRRDALLTFALTSVPMAIPFVFIVARDPANFFTGYIGGKALSESNPFEMLLGNVVRALLALHVRGDVVFRSNPTNQPHLDVVSGVLFLAGVVFWLRPGRRHLSPALLVPLLLLQVPSILVLRYPDEVPSASRTLAITPMAYILVASGLWWGFDTIRRTGWVARFALLGILLAILGLNVDRYFNAYADGLPDHNTPYGRIIAAYVDGLSPDTQVYVVGCCWGAWGQPEPQGIQYALTHPHTLAFVSAETVSCSWLDSTQRPMALIWNPTDDGLDTLLDGCLGPVQPYRYVSPRGAPVFQAMILSRP